MQYGVDVMNEEYSVLETVASTLVELLPYAIGLAVVAYLVLT